MLSSQTRADYFDVTLVGDDSKYNLAHKVVLATSSAKRVHPHPLVNFDIATFRFRNFLVSKLFHVFLWYRYRFRKKIGIKKSIGFGFAQILGFVTHCTVIIVIIIIILVKIFIVIKANFQLKYKLVFFEVVGP